MLTGRMLHNKASGENAAQCHNGYPAHLVKPGQHQQAPTPPVQTPLIDRQHTCVRVCLTLAKTPGCHHIITSPLTRIVPDADSWQELSNGQHHSRLSCCNHIETQGMTMTHTGLHRSLPNILSRISDPWQLFTSSEHAPCCNRPYAAHKRLLVHTAWLWCHFTLHSLPRSGTLVAVH
jgi:hypothetical protein